jgi:hypothetical protein
MGWCELTTGVFAMVEFLDPRLGFGIQAGEGVMV